MNAIIFADRKAFLNAEVAPDLRRRYREAIVNFQSWIQQAGKSATPENFKEHLEWMKACLPPEECSLRQEALRWYYRRDVERMKGQGGGVPEPAKPNVDLPNQ